MLVDLERRRESFAWRQGWAEMWTLGGRAMVKENGEWSIVEENGEGEEKRGEVGERRSEGNKSPALRCYLTWMYLSLSIAREEYFLSYRG